MKTKIIADVSSNHMGDMSVAQSLIREAALAGVDIVKFQSWQADRLRPDFPEYEATYKRHKKTELTDDDHRMLIDYCSQSGVEFLTTCFDITRMDFLSSLGLKTIKVASPDSMSFGMIGRLIDKFEHVIVSTGMTTDVELKKLVQFVMGKNVTLLHCVSLYPTPIEDVNLDRMLWIRSMGVETGFSDHSIGVTAGMFAIALGASIVEKHITLSRSLPGKDQAMSTTPDEFKVLCDWANSVEQMKGTAQHELSREEEYLRKIYRGKWGSN
ncbi:MAG: N-acetylneuraminate synthase family protein [Nitrospirae bacterium]|nr:N-acetylneuraminate synthase family protein [Nitrospirota bacterium]